VHERVVAAGGESRLSVYDDVHHGWQMLTPFVPEARAALGEAAGFIRAHLDGSGGSRGRSLLSAQGHRRVDASRASGRDVGREGDHET
jgi:hypothetical protein